MARPTTNDELTLHRTPGDWSRFRLAIHLPQSVYTALVNGVPASNDMVNQIQYDGGVGTLADIHDDMLMYVGTTAGARDLGIVRLRKAPDVDTFFFGETSVIVWQDNAYLTVVDAFAIRERPVRVASGVTYMDSDIVFNDQHVNFDPVPVLGPHIVVRMEGASVGVTLGPPADTLSWVFDSTIASVAWVIPDATIIDNAAAINPVATFDTAGWHACYCTVTAANGKSFEGVRYVYIWNTANPPARDFMITQDPECNYDEGGYSFDVDLYDEASLGLVRDGALVILFAEDWYGSTQQSIGPIVGRENIVVIGWVAGESIEWDPETGGRVKFSVQGPQYWMNQNTKYALELFFATNTPDAWNVMPNLSVARAIWHLLHWRFNVTKLMDVILTDDQRMTMQIKSTSISLWNQIQDIAFKKVFAQPGCDRYGRLFVEIDPQMVPEADRNFPVVQTITKKDWQDRIEVERRTLTDLCILFASGEMVSEGGSANTLYSLAPGHMPLPYGDSDILEELLVSDQTQSNEQAGLYMGWRNNELPEIQIVIPQNNRMIDLFPRQYLDITIQEGDTPRGITYSGNIIPRSIALRIDRETGTLSTELTCEAETFAYPATDGDIPITAGGDDYDFSIPPLPELPNLDDLLDFGAIVYPAPTDVNLNHPKRVVIASNQGVLFTENFDVDNPTWTFMNAGLSTFERESIANMVVTPTGEIYILTSGDNTTGYDKVMVADGLGGAWRTVFENTEYPETGSQIWGLGVNPNAPDEIAIWGGRMWSWPTDGNIGKFFIGIGNGAGIALAGFTEYPRHAYSTVLFTNNGWTIFCNQGTGILGNLETPYCLRFSSAGNLQTATQFPGVGGGSPMNGCAAGTQDLSFYWEAGVIYKVTANGTVTTAQTISPGDTQVQGVSASPTGTHLMGTNGSTPQKTTDGGATWSSVAGTIPIGSDVWENCQDDNRWIFGGGTVIRVTTDQGLTYANKQGNLGYIATLIDITHMRYIS